MFYFEDRRIAYKLQKKYIQQAQLENNIGEEYKEENHHRQKPKKPRVEQNNNIQISEPKKQEEDNYLQEPEEDDLQVNKQPFKKEKKSFKMQMQGCLILKVLVFFYPILF